MGYVTAGELASGMAAAARNRLPVLDNQVGALLAWNGHLTNLAHTELFVLALNRDDAKYALGNSRDIKYDLIPRDAAQ